MACAHAIKNQEQMAKLRSAHAGEMGRALLAACLCLLAHRTESKLKNGSSRPLSPCASTRSSRTKSLRSPAMLSCAAVPALCLRCALAAAQTLTYTLLRSLHSALHGLRRHAAGARRLRREPRPLAQPRRVRRPPLLCRCSAMLTGSDRLAHSHTQRLLLHHPRPTAIAPPLLRAHPSTAHGR